MRKEVLFTAFILGMILLVSGVDQCAQQGGSFGGGGQTQAAKYGVDFTTQQGLDKLSEGKTVYLGNSFLVDILMENFDSEPKSGQICIRDDIDDAYGGIPSRCKAFNIPAASYIQGNLDSPATLDIVFPDSGYYSYSNLPIDTSATLYISASYGQSSTASAIIKAPQPESEAITFTQTPSPLTVSAEKTITSTDSGAKLNLKININKQGDYNITTRDFKREAIGMSTNFGSYNLECPAVAQGFIDFKNTKFISCSALLPKEQLSHPLIVYLDYGVQLNDKISFNIKKEVA